MSVISPVSSLAKQRQKRPGAKRILSRLRACRPTPVKRVIHHLHPDGHIGTGVASLRHRRAPIPISWPTDKSVIHELRLEASGWKHADLTSNASAKFVLLTVDSGSLASGLPLGGRVSGVMNKSGDFNFRSQAHDSGFDNINYVVSAVLITPDGFAFTFQHSGHTRGRLPVYPSALQTARMILSLPPEITL
jgi:hypothetical protein